MTVERENVDSGPFVGNGATVTFPFDFHAASASEVAVEINGVRIDPSLFSVSLEDDGTGSITFFVAPIGSIFIVSDPLFNQEVNFQDQGPFYQSSVNEPIDRSALRDLVLRDMVSRAPVRPRDYASVLGLFPVLMLDGTWGFSNGYGEDTALRGDLASAIGALIVNASAGGVGAIAQSLASRLDVMPVYAVSYGLSAANTAVQNKTALKRAVAATPTGGILVIPRGSYAVDVLLGLDDAITVDRQMTIQIDGVLTTNLTCTNAPAVNGVDVSGDHKPKPPYLFKITAAAVSFVGSGTLKTNGTYNDQNFGDEGVQVTMPGFIYVTANDFSFEGITIDTPSKVGIYLLSCFRARIATDFIGGPPTHSEGPGEGVGGSDRPHTAYFGVRSNGGGQHFCINSRFLAGLGVTGGKYTQAIWSGGFAGAANQWLIQGCYADVWEKLLYGYGDYHRVFDNRIENALRTDIVRIDGSYAKVSRNTGDNVLGICLIFDGHDNEVSNNYFTRIRQTAVNIQRSSGAYVGGFDRTRVIDNVFQADTTSAGRAHGIAFYIDGSDGGDIDVIGNTVTGFAPTNGLAGILMQAINTATLRRIRVNRNKISNCNSGIIFSRNVRYEARDNVFDSIGANPIVTSASATGTFTGNRGLGSVTTLNISGFNATTDYANDNQWDDNLLEFTVTLPSGSSTVTVAKAFIAANAKVSGEPANDAARLAAAPNGTARISVSGTNVSVAHATGNNATANENYIVRVRQ